MISYIFCIHSIILLQVNLKQMNPTTQITQANLRYDTFSLGICSIRSAEGSGKSHSAFPSKPMMIHHDTDANGTNTIQGSYIRDLDFSFIVENNTSFQVGLFLYNPKYMKMSDVRDCYRKDGLFPNNSDYFHNIGIYTIKFDVNNMNESDIKRNHFIAYQKSDNNQNYMKFDFYFMKLNEEDHSHILRGRSNIYYISNPFVTFNPNEIQ